MHPDDLVSIEAAADFINQHFTTEITIAKLMAHCGLQATKLKILFKQVYGLTPHEFQQVLRMQSAVNLLREQYQVKEIAQMLGYSTTGNFSTAFLLYTGYRPSDYLHK